MRRTGILFLAFLGIAFLCAPAQGGFNPDNTGIIQNCDLTIGDGNVTDANQYSTAITGAQSCKAGAILCVKCHSRNPSARTPIRVAGDDNVLGSHFVTFAFNDTHEGGGYSDGKVRAADNSVYMGKFGATGKTWIWYDSPRYSYINLGLVTDVTDPATAAVNMTCNSCHNLYVNSVSKKIPNTGRAKLLANGFANDNTTLCIGCHGDMDGALSAEWQYFGTQTGGPAWTGTHHHRNSQSVDADTYYYQSTSTDYDIKSSTHDMNTMSKAYYSVSGFMPAIQMWAANYGTLGSTSNPDARPISMTAWNTKGTGVDNIWKNLSTADGAKYIGVSPAGNPTGIGGGTILCTNCHRAHNADSSMSATILVRGDDTSLYGSLGTQAVSRANAFNGVRRMDDRGGRAASINNMAPLCTACHK